MTFIQKFTGWVRGWKLDKFFKGLVNGDEGAADQLRFTIEQSNQFVNNVKAYLNSPIGDFVTSVIPGTWDDELKSKAQAVLNIFGHNQATLTGCMALSTPGEQLSCVYGKVLSLNNEDEKDSFWVKLAAFSAKVFADGRITISDAGIAAKFIYDLVTKKVNG